MSSTARQTAEERREAVLLAAAAGISQPYLFRLFGTKKELFVATVDRCMDDTVELFRTAAATLRGQDALEAMGDAYVEMVTTDRDRLLLQLQAYAACGDDDVREAMRRGFGNLYRYVEAVSGLPMEAVAQWFAKGMLLNVITSMDLWNARDAWSQRLIEGCVGAEHLQAG
jgi:AcrR family transcriptional regulator